MDTSTGPARDPPLGLMPLPNGSDQRDTGAIKEFYADVEVGGDLGEHDTCPVDSIRRSPVIGNALR
jgi:hypothetical protein